MDTSGRSRAAKTGAAQASLHRGTRFASGSRSFAIGGFQSSAEPTLIQTEIAFRHPAGRGPSPQRGIEALGSRFSGAISGISPACANCRQRDLRRERQRASAADGEMVPSSGPKRHAARGVTEEPAGFPSIRQCLAARPISPR